MNHSKILVSFIPLILSFASEAAADDVEGVHRMGVLTGVTF